MPTASRSISITRGLLGHGDGLLEGNGLKCGLYPGDDIPLERIGMLMGEAIALFA